MLTNRGTIESGRAPSGLPWSVTETGSSFRVELEGKATVGFIRRDPPKEGQRQSWSWESATGGRSGLASRREAVRELLADLG